MAVRLPHFVASLASQLVDAWRSSGACDTPGLDVQVLRTRLVDGFIRSYGIFSLAGAGLCAL